MNKTIMEGKVSKKQLWVITCVLFCISVIIRFGLADFNKTIIVYPDELRYLYLSQSLLDQGKLLIRNCETDFQKILYPLFIMPAFLFEKAGMQIRCITFLNCIYASSAVFPVLLLAFKILKSRWQIIFALVLTIIMPTMTMSMTFMSENIYYPLCLWLFLLILDILEAGGGKKKIAKCALLGILSYLLYLNKEISLAFLIAYIAIEGYYFLKEIRLEKEWKAKLARCYGPFSTVVSFMICFLAMKLTLFRGMGNSYNQMGIEAVASIEGFSFLWYAFLYNILFAIVAFMAVPILLPLLQWKNMNLREKQCYIFLVLSLAVILFVISYTISVREDIGKEGIRQHTRYYEPLFILFIINFMAVMSRRDSKIRYQDWLLPMAISILIISIMKKIGMGSSVDSCMLKYYQYAQVRFDYKWVKALQCTMCGGIMLFTVAWKKYGKSMSVLALGIISVVSIMNNVFAVNIFKQEYGRISGQHVEEWEKLNAYLEEKDSKVLVISKERYGGEVSYADTYLRAYANYIVQGEIGELPDSADKYKDFEYILTHAYRGIKDAEMEMRCGPYALYKRKDMQHIELTELPSFPVLDNQTRIITSEENVFQTQSKAKNQRYSYISDREEGFLICGPYTKVQPGLYDVIIYYGYEGTEEEGEIIGRLDMKYKEEEPDRCTDLKAGGNKAELRGVRVEEFFDYGEIRIFTTVPGVIFYKAEITRRGE